MEIQTKTNKTNNRPKTISEIRAEIAKLKDDKKKFEKQIETAETAEELEKEANRLRKEVDKIRDTTSVINKRKLKKNFNSTLDKIFKIGENINEMFDNNEGDIF